MHLLSAVFNESSKIGRAETNAVMYPRPPMDFSGGVFYQRLVDSLLEAHERSRSKIMKDRSGKVTITDDNGNVYEGEFSDGAMHGVGKMKYKDGRIREGIWEKGEIKYEGELNDNGKPHGRGKWIYSDGTYEGYWQNGVKHGIGTYKWADGRLYEGNFKADKRHGTGTYKWSDGSTYVGEWIDDARNGTGTCNYKYGSLHSYTGGFYADKRHGFGTMTYPNLDMYFGQWKENRKDGNGTMRFHNGDVYQGEFKNGKMHGKGVFTYAAGDVLKSTGEWKRGKMVGFFEDEVRVSKQVYYDEDDSKSDSKPKRDTLDFAIRRRHKRRKVSKEEEEDVESLIAYGYVYEE